MIEQPSVVDENGDIYLHSRQGAVLRIEFVDVDGVPRDMRSSVVTFEVGPTIDVVLTQDPDSMAIKLLTLTPDLSKSILLARDKSFAVVDSTGPIQTVVWAGVVYVTGWVE